MGTINKIYTMPWLMLADEWLNTKLNVCFFYCDRKHRLAIHGLWGICFKNLPRFRVKDSSGNPFERNEQKIAADSLTFWCKSIS